MNQNLASLLVQAREKAGLTQAEVGARLGLGSAQFISNCERGVCSLPMKHVLKVSRLLKLSVDDIIDARALDMKHEFRAKARSVGQKKRVP